MMIRQVRFIKGFRAVEPIRTDMICFGTENRIKTRANKRRKETREQVRARDQKMRENPEHLTSEVEREQSGKRNRVKIILRFRYSDKTLGRRLFCFRIKPSVNVFKTLQNRRVIPTR